MSKTINQVKEWFAILGINVELKFTGKSISINGTNFRLPTNKTSFENTMDFETKITSHVRSLLPEKLENELTEKYNELNNSLKELNIHIDFRQFNYGVTVYRDVKRSIEDAKRLLEFVSNYPDFYSIIEKYSAYANLLNRDWDSIIE